MMRESYNAEDFVCNNCGDIYNLGELEVFAETLDIVDGRPYIERYYVCPGCGSDEIDRLNQKGLNELVETKG